jgi:hypothetical protein
VHLGCRIILTQADVNELPEQVDIRNTHTVFGGFEGHFIRNKAQMEWTGTVGDYKFVLE